METKVGMIRYLVSIPDLTYPMRILNQTVAILSVGKNQAVFLLALGVITLAQYIK
jgi:hypothetical protein